MGHALRKEHPLPRPARRGLSRVEAADFFGVSPSTLDKMVRDGKAPKPFAIYGRWVYDSLECDQAFNRLKGDDVPPASNDLSGWDDYQ